MVACLNQNKLSIFSSHPVLWYFRGAPRNHLLLCGALAVLSKANLHQISLGLGCFLPHVIVGLSLLDRKMRTVNSHFVFGGV